MKISDEIVREADRIYWDDIDGEDGFDSMKKALSAVLSKLMVKVRQLEWVNNYDDDHWRCQANDEFSINRWWEGSLYYFEVGEDADIRYDTLDEAKAGAQADFERRVRECITLNPIKLTDGEINDITYDKLGKWPSFEAQSWACKVVHTVLSQIAINSVDMAAVMDDGLIKELEDAAAWRRLPDHENHHATALLFERAVERIRALSAEPAQG